MYLGEVPIGAEVPTSMSRSVWAGVAAGVAAIALAPKGKESKYFVGIAALLVAGALIAGEPITFFGKRVL